MNYIYWCCPSTDKSNDEPITGHRNYGYAHSEGGGTTNSNRNFNNGQNRQIAQHSSHSSRPVVTRPPSILAGTSSTRSPTEGSTSLKSPNSIKDQALASQKKGQHFSLPSQTETQKLSDEDQKKLTEKRISISLETTLEQAKFFVEEIKAFEELEDSNKYYYIEESLKRLVDRLDNMFDNIEEIEDLRNKRKEVYKFIFQLFDELDKKLEENKKRIQGNRT